MKRLDLKSALVGALLSATAFLSLAAASNSRTEWEYKVVAGQGYPQGLDKQINAAVAEGWEFVSASGPNAEMWGLAVLRREKK